MNKQDIIKKHFAKLGRSRSKKKLASLAANRAKAAEKRRTPFEVLESAYQKVKSGSATKSEAYRLAKCRYDRFVDYVERREAGESASSIASDT